MVLGKGTETAATSQLLERDKIVARAASSNIASFFQVFGDSLAVLSNLDSMERRDGSTVHDLDVFVDQWRESDLVGGVVLTDRQGIVRFNSNVLGTHDLGADLSDRDYFVWARNQAEEGMYYIGVPVVSRLGATEGETIVPVASPVFQDGAFLGVVATSVRIYPLTSRFLRFMKFSEETDVYLLDQRGGVLYSNNGKVISDNIKNRVVVGKEGGFRVDGSLVSFSPVVLGEQHWSLAVANPARKVNELAEPVYIRQTAVMLLVFFSFLLFGMVASRG